MSTAHLFFPKKQHLPPRASKKVDFSHDGRMALVTGRCPYCDTDDVEGCFFGGSDDRDGGFLDCPHCHIAISWIDNPFEAEQVEYP